MSLFVGSSRDIDVENGYVDTVGGGEGKLGE